MNEKNIARLLGHQTILDQTLQKQLTRSLTLTVSNAHAIARTVEYEKKQMRNALAVMARVAEYEKKQTRDALAVMARVVEYGQKRMKEALTMVEREAKAYASLNRHLADIGTRAVELHQYRQKQLSLISAMQANLGFPNIIRSRSSVNPSHISALEQHNTLSPESSPTAIASETDEKISPEIIPVPSSELVPITNHKPVFIVHGHDHKTRDDVSKFISNWGLTPTVLDEQPNKGRTIIEKFEECADKASFAIILLTPDDVGGLASAKHMDDLKPRARQKRYLGMGLLLWFNRT